MFDRHLDGVYFRVQRDGKWGNVCFSDMTEAERDLYIGDRSRDWWKSMACIMADRLREIGDELNLIWE